MGGNVEDMETKLADATASIEETGSDEILRFYIGKAIDEYMKLKAIGDVSDENVEHLVTQLAYDCYRVGYVAQQK
ncbi:hypothetical protein [Paenibacillus xerothermodurans]|uniref:Uncharacterized protein n=1 Tax=Paenibacillus xerothermodurans TaxID=1977292 RepID=A0A2W1NPL2_PAEXE|nr:hypothetical protein [Paenibacillus xerothermodurans]PZE19666.1 hypothetical protein CBW46_017135 [Paenibacillus xerothermodurans]